MVVEIVILDCRDMLRDMVIGYDVGDKGGG